MDMARTVNRMGAKEVIVVYRRAKKQMPAEEVEVEEAEKEGVSFLLQNNIVRILGKERVEQIECIKTELIKVEGERERPVNIEGSNYMLKTDFVLMALRSKTREKSSRKIRARTE